MHELYIQSEKQMEGKDRKLKKTKKTHTHMGHNINPRFTTINFVKLQKLFGTD